ncbi:MAG: hypothetical protein NVSMB49_17650 [Ktedonobacteraceae bacterium]
MTAFRDSDAVGELTRPPDDTYAQELVGRFLMMRRFLPTLWRTLEFESTPGGRPTLQAVQFLQRIERLQNAHPARFPFAQSMQGQAHTIRAEVRRDLPQLYL